MSSILYPIPLHHSPGLFRREDNPKASLLAYEATFYPFSTLGEKHRIAWKHACILSKTELLDTLNEDATAMILPGIRGCTSFPIFWLYNAIPTEIEFQKMGCESQFLVEARISPLIPDGGRSALLSIIHASYSSHR